jgi:murein endopeptidase
LTSQLIAAALVLLSAGTLAQTVADSRQRFAEWAGITLPLPGTPSAIGFYSAGCLQGGQILPLDGTRSSTTSPRLPPPGQVVRTGCC